MNTDQPAFHLLSLDILLADEPVQSNETPDLSNAPLSFEEREQRDETRSWLKDLEGFWR